MLKIQGSRSKVNPAGIGKYQVGVSTFDPAVFYVLYSKTCIFVSKPASVV